MQTSRATNSASCFGGMTQHSRKARRTEASARQTLRKWGKRWFFLEPHAPYWLYNAPQSLVPLCGRLASAMSTDHDPPVAYCTPSQSTWPALHHQTTVVPPDFHASCAQGPPKNHARPGVYVPHKPYLYCNAGVWLSLQLSDAHHFHRCVKVSGHCESYGHLFSPCSRSPLIPAAPPYLTAQYTFAVPLRPLSGFVVRTFCHFIPFLAILFY